MPLSDRFMTENTRDFYVDKLKPLVGGKVLCTIQDGDYFGLCIQKFKTLHNVWFMRDDEGNGPGSISIDSMDHY